MKAIVLTYDKYHPIADHMIQCYMELWPDNPFVFRVPYQTYPESLKKKYGSKIELIKTPKGIKDTMMTLLQDIEDDEWVYWCMDDRYPVELDLKRLLKIHKWVFTLDDKNVVNICFSYEMAKFNSKNVEKYTKHKNVGLSTKRIKNYRFMWFHQFFKTKALKYFFQHVCKDIKTAKEMDYNKNNLSLPPDHIRLVTRRRLMAFGESTNRGKITKNCIKSFNKKGMTVPDYLPMLDAELFKGFNAREKPKAYYIIRNYYHKTKTICQGLWN